MKKSKLLVACGLAALVLGVSACGGQSSGYEYALVTDVGDIDDESFNQTSWEALRDYAEENGKSYNYYRPTEDSTRARLAAIDQAVQRGAKVIVCPGYLFEDAVYEAQTTYPDVKFVLLDGTPKVGDDSNTADNTVSIVYQEELSGFLAGYAIVMEGKRSLGFCGGMAVPAVQRFGSGFVQGADYAANQLGVDVDLNYYYANAFAATDAANVLMRSWYSQGIETVFACGGKVYQSVQTACDEAANGTWIGVDVDQSSVSEKVITSAVKGLRESVQSALQIYDEDNWDLIGGNNYTLGLQSVLGDLEPRNYVGLPTSERAWRFSNFTQAQYETVLASLGNGSIEVDDSTTTAPSTTRVDVTWESAFAGESN